MRPPLTSFLASLPGAGTAADSASPASPPLAIAGFTQILRWPLILSLPKLAAEFYRTEGITIKLVIRGVSAGFADVW
jgi:hypothetical protein